MEKYLSDISFLTDVVKTSCQYPSIAITQSDKVFVSWQSFEGGKETIMVAELENDKVTNEFVVSGDGESFKSAVFTIGETLYVAWSECFNGTWDFMLRKYDGKWNDAICLKTGKMEFYPSFSLNEDVLWLFWTSLNDGKIQTVAKTIEDDKISDLIVISDELQAFRPNAVVNKLGQMVLVYDVFNGTHYDIIARVLVDGKFVNPKVISNRPRFASQACIQPTQDGFLINWTDHTIGSEYAYLCGIIEIKDNEVEVKSVEVILNEVNWCINVSNVYDPQKELYYMIYNRGQRQMNMRKYDGVKWSNALAVSPVEEDFELRGRAAIDSKGMMYLTWQHGNKNGHKDRYSKICLRKIDTNLLKDTDYCDPETSLDQFVLPISTPKVNDKSEEKIVEEFLSDSVCFKGMNVYFGDIHGQSGVSDGLGEIDQYYNIAKVRADLDFCALTDHDCFPDVITESEWQYITTHANVFNTDAMATLLAIEWTPNEYCYDYGHKNVYYRGDNGPAIRSTEENGRTPDRVWAALEGYDAMTIPHHPSANWGLVSAATDWNFHNPKYQRLVEIYSRHAPFETYEETSIYTKNIKKFEDKNVDNALARNYRLGFTAGSDSHQMEHGYEGGIVALFADKLTRENVFDSLYDRRCYGTSGARIIVDFSIDQKPMGQELVKNNEESNKLLVRVLGTSDIEKVIVIKNGEIFYTDNVNGRIANFNIIDEKRGQNDFYYVKVIQKDQHLAWSSPIWVDREI